LRDALTETYLLFAICHLLSDADGLRNALTETLKKYLPGKVAKPDSEEKKVLRRKAKRLHKVLPQHVTRMDRQ